MRVRRLVAVLSQFDRARTTAVWVTSLMVACSGDRESLDLPPSGGARSEILAVYRPEGREVYALDLTEMDPGIEFEISSDAVDVEALLYPEPLEELGLVAGRLFSVTNSNAVPLPRPGSTYTNVVGGDGPNGWTPQAAPSERLASFRISPVPSPCPTFETQLVTIGEESAHPVFAVAFDETSALVGTSTGTIYRIHIDGQVDKIPLATTATVIGMELGEDGLHVTLDNHRRTSRARLDNGVLHLDTVLEDGPPDQRLWDAHVDSAGNIEAGLTTADGELYMLADRVWRRVGSFDSRGVLVSGGATRVASAHFVYSRRLEGEVGRFRDGVLSFETVVADSEVQAVHHTVEFGTIAGTSDGRLFADGSGEWAQFFDSGFDTELYQLESYEGLVVYGGARLGGMVSRISACELEVFHPARRIARVGPHLFFVGSRFDGLRATFFVRK